MRIEAAGKTWIVEEQALDRGNGSGLDRVSGVTFRNANHEPDQLHVRWVLTPDHLTPSLARELFELAAVRDWQDPRDARPYQLDLETQTGAVTDRAANALEAVRFQSGQEVIEAPWTLDKPLGWASDAELIALLDGALHNSPPETSLR